MPANYRWRGLPAKNLLPPMHDLRPVSLLGIMPRTSVVRSIEVRSLTVPLFLNTLEQSGLSTWLRESDSVFGFYFILAVHTIGLALVVGPNAAIDLRLLGVAPDIVSSRATALALAFVALATVVELTLLSLAWPAGTPNWSDIFIFAAINAVQAGWILIVLLILRAAGYRLWWVGRG